MSFSLQNQLRDWTVIPKRLEEIVFFRHVFQEGYEQNVCENGHFLITALSANEMAKVSN